MKNNRALNLIWVLTIVVFFLLLGYVIYPQFNIYLRSFQIEQLKDIAVASTELWRSTFSTQINRDAIINSVGISIVSVILALIYGSFHALLTELINFRGRKLLLIASVLPLTLPPLIGVLSMVRLFGVGGILPRILSEIFGREQRTFTPSTLSGILIVHTYSFSIYFFILVRSGLKSLNYSTILAARSLKASRSKLIFRHILPIISPQIVAASIIVFMISMGSYSAPVYMVTGSKYIPNLTVEIAYNYQSGRYGIAAVLATTLSLICISLLLILQFGFRRYWTFNSAGTKGSSLPVMRSNISSVMMRSILCIYSLIIITIMSLPLTIILITSFADFKHWILTDTIFPTKFYLNNFREIFSDSTIHLHPILVSLYSALCAMVFNLILGLASAILIAKGNKFVRYGIEICSMIPLALPGTVIAFNLALTFGNNSSVLTFGNAMRNTFWIIVLVYVVRQVPLALRPIISSVSKLESQLELASKSLGAGIFMTFRKVVLPQIYSGMIAAALICFVTGAGEFVASVLVSSTKWTPISIKIAESLADSQGIGPASAYAAILMIMTSGAIIVYDRLTNL